MTMTITQHDTTNETHLTPDEYINSTRAATRTASGLMPAGMIFEGVLVDAPKTSTRPAVQGMRAVGNGYYYRRTQDGTWKRALLEDF